MSLTIHIDFSITLYYTTPPENDLSEIEDTKQKKYTMNVDNIEALHPCRLGFSYYHLILFV